MFLSFLPNLYSKASPLDLVCICVLCEFVKSHLKQDGYDDCMAKDGVQLGLDATPNDTKASKSSYVIIRQYMSALHATPYEGKGIEVSVRQHT